MPDRAANAAAAVPEAAVPDAADPSARRFRAGCGRVAAGPARQLELAYLELAFPECPTCPHRIVPDDGAPFCRWRAEDASDAGPFAALAALELGDLENEDVAAPLESKPGEPEGPR